MKPALTATERALAYVCPYVPEEIILAAGFRPFRFLPDANPSDADAHIHPNTCGYLKSLLAAGLRAAMPGVDGIVFANCCDGMRRLHDIWEKYVPGIPPVFLDIPKRNDRLSVEYFASELKRLAGRIRSAHGLSREVQEAEIERSIRTCNRNREERMEIFPRWRRNDVRADAAGLYALGQGTSRAPETDFPEQADRILAGKTVPPVEENRKGVVLSGSILRRPDLLFLIEASGGRISALDSCLTARRFPGRVEEGSADPYLALAQRTLTQPPCPRMAAFEDRCENLLSLVRESGAGGLIYFPLKHCEPFRYDTLLLLERFRGEGIPVLVLEDEFQTPIPEQVRTRVQAFLETVGGHTPCFRP